VDSAIGEKVADVLNFLIREEVKHIALFSSMKEKVEAPRFFEVLLRGQHHPEVTHLASRICGICAVSHKSAALKATEAALGVEISAQTRRLRRLAYYGEIISSHVRHIIRPPNMPAGIGRNTWSVPWPGSTTIISNCPRRPKRPPPT
jgi:hypothetical protein